MKKIIQAVGIFLTLALFISACLPETTAAQEPQQQEPQVENTPTLDTQSMVNTAVAQTVEAQNQIGTAVALTTEAQYTAMPTTTPFTIPTVTPFIVSTPTTKPAGASVPAKPSYACDVILVRPRAYSEFTRGQDFDIKMTVVNTGSRDWYQGFDLKYSGGTVMTTTTPHIELPAMAPGAKHQVVLDAAAPTERGTHTMTWTVEGRICFGYVTIIVK